MTWRAAALAVWSLFLIIATAATTASIRNNHCEAREARAESTSSRAGAAALQTAVVGRDAKQAQNDAGGATLEQHLAEHEAGRPEHIQEVTREVVKTVYRCAVPPAGRRLLLQADDAGRAALSAEAAGQ